MVGKKLLTLILVLFLSATLPASATISSTASQTTVFGNGATTVFSFSFVADSASAIQVVYTSPSGVTTTLAPSVYSVHINPATTNQLWGVGGSVTYPLSGSPIASGASLTISRILPLTQTVSLTNQGSFYPQTVEQALDTNVMQTQQLSARTGSLRGTWLTNTAYNVGDVVLDGASGNNTGNYYTAAVQNVSTTWVADLASGDWSLSLPASIPTASLPLVIGNGGTGSTSASGALTNLGAAGTASNNTFSGLNTFSSAATFNVSTTFNGNPYASGSFVTVPAVCDNSTNNDAVIATAISNAASGNTLVFPAGRCLFTTMNLLGKTGIKIQGQGNTGVNSANGTTLKCTRSDSSDCINAQGTSYVGFQDLTVNASNTSYTGNMVDASTPGVGFFLHNVTLVGTASKGATMLYTDGQVSFDGYQVLFFDGNVLWQGQNHAGGGYANVFSCRLCSFQNWTTAAIRDPGDTWLLDSGIFEMGGATTPAILGSSGVYITNLILNNMWLADTLITDNNIFLNMQNLNGADLNVRASGGGSSNTTFLKLGGSGGNFNYGVTVRGSVGAFGTGMNVTQTSYNVNWVPSIQSGNVTQVTGISNIYGGTINNGSSIQTITPGATTTATTINAAGEVGVGTSGGFGNMLSVYGGASIGAAYENVGAPGNGALIQGYVGIGTNSPATQLDVNGSVTLESFTAGNLVCITTSKALGHCTGGVSCSGSTCTCSTCTVN